MGPIGLIFERLGYLGSFSFWKSEKQECFVVQCALGLRALMVHPNERFRNGDVFRDCPPHFMQRYLSSGPRCVMSKNEVVSFSRLVTTEAGFVQCLVAGLAILKITEPPATRCGVLF